MPNIVFPENSSSIISEILEKHGLQESEKEISDKFETEEKTRGEIIAELVEKTGEQKISFNDFISSLKIELNITQKTAESVAEDIKKEILDIIEKPEDKKEKPLKKRGKDVYREKIE